MKKVESKALFWYLFEWLSLSALAVLLVWIVLSMIPFWSINTMELPARVIAGLVLFLVGLVVFQLRRGQWLSDLAEKLHVDIYYVYIAYYGLRLGEQKILESGPGLIAMVKEGVQR